MKKIHLKSLLFALIAVTYGCVVLDSTAFAQVRFPTRPLTLWVGFPAGGAADILARALAEGAEKSLGQKIVVVNKPGGGGTVATSLLVKEKPDGYTLLLTTDTPITRAPHISDLEYDPFRDLDHSLMIGRWKNVWTVKADSPFKKWEELVDWSKKNQGQLVFGHCVASSFYFGMVRIAKKEGFTFRGVPFPCETPTITALLGGHTMLGGGTAAPYRSHVSANTIRILLADEKVDYATGYTTLHEMHYDFEVPLLATILAPKGIPDGIREILEKALIDGMKSETFMRVAKEQELIVKPSTGKAFFDFLKKTSLTYEEIIKEAGMYKTRKK